MTRILVIGNQRVKREAQRQNANSLKTWKDITFQRKVVYRQ